MRNAIFGDISALFPPISAFLRSFFPFLFAHFDFFLIFATGIYNLWLMKKVIIVLMMALMSLCAQAQNVLQSMDKYPVYCNVMGYNFWGVGKVKVQLDLGRKANSKGFDSLYDENGKKMKFNTMVAVLNYMGLRGWKCINTYYITKGNTNVIHYLLEKWVTSDEEVIEGLSLQTDTDEPWKPGKTGDDVY